jgi:hypothetical protein
MLEFLKLYPNKTSLLVGIAIGLGTHILSTSLCGFFTVCTDTNLATNPHPYNPAFPFATFIGSLVVGTYCSWLVKGKRKFIVGFVFTLLTMFAALKGSRGFFDNFLGEESLLSHALLYGVITLVFVSATSILNKSEPKN